MEHREDEEDAEQAFLHRSFVQEAEVLDALVASIVQAKGHADPTIFKKAQSIIEKYQEQGQLLEPHLESMITPIMGIVRAIALEADGGKLETSQMLALKKLCCIVHTLMTVCGYKTVVKFFPHHAADLELAVALLEQCQQEVTVSSILKEETTGEWETKCSLLLWLSILVLIPFDLASVDTALAEPRAMNTSNANEEETPPLVQRMLKICMDHLERPGPTREMAGVLLSRLLTRPDMRSALRSFMAWTREVLATLQEDMVGVFLVPGIVGALAAIFKVGGRDILLDVAPIAWGEATELASSQAASRSPLLRKLLVKLIQRIGNTYLPPRVASWRYMRGSRSLIQNLASVSGDMHIKIEHSPGDKAVVAGNALGDHVSPVVESEDTEEDFEVPDILEEVIEQLLAGLRDKDTVVRWSAAKGVGRVTGRLTLLFADDVVASVLELFQPTEGDGAWHGGCLALAELARRGLLLPERLPTVCPVIVQALHYDVRRGPHSVGSHVRDAAAYVCWAFVRAYSSAIMIPHLKILAPALLTVACYDREVNCRRAAAAAFQEAVGRQGDFLHGIDIVTAADYFSLGTRANAYRIVGAFIAQYDEYRFQLIDELLSTKLRHWDRSLRELSAEALAALVKYDPTYFETSVLGALVPSTLSTDLCLRHGAILAAAEVIRALHDHGHPLTPEKEKAIAGMVPAIDKARLYRGKGGEIMRSAVSRLIECTAEVKVRLSPKVQKTLHDTLDENLKHPNGDIQGCAVTALRSFVRSYLLPVSAATVARTTGKYIDILKTDPNPAARRGAALSFSALPAQLLAPMWKEVLDALSAATIAEERQEDQDAETRVNAVCGLTAVCEMLFARPVESINLAGADDVVHKAPKAILREQVMKVLLNALDDYAVDNRGDVGSWVREAAMDGLKRCSFLLCTSNSGRGNLTQVATPDCSQSFAGEAERRQTATNDVESFFDEEIAMQVVGGLAKQAVEKIDRVRDVAGRTLQQLLHSEQVFVQHVPHRTALEQIIPTDPNLNWAAPSESFPRLVRLLRFPEYRSYVLSGIVISIGGLTDSLGKTSSQALFDFLQEEPHVGSGIGALGDSNYVWLGKEMLQLLKTYKGTDRLIIPALKAFQACALCIVDHYLSEHYIPPEHCIGCIWVVQTLDILFSKGVFSHSMWAEDKFAMEMLEFVKTDLCACKDVAKMLAGINVLSHFALWPEPAGSNALIQLLTLLGYRYPKVRKVCAEQVYLLLIQRGDQIVGEESVEIGLEVLGETAWDGPIESIRGKREKLFDLFHLQKPAVVTSSAPLTDVRKLKQVSRDENQSYAALLNAEEQY